MTDEQQHAEQLVREAREHKRSANYHRRQARIKLSQVQELMRRHGFEVIHISNAGGHTDHGRSNTDQNSTKDAR